MTTREPDDEQLAVAIRAFAVVKAADDATLAVPLVQEAVAVPT
ncbi:MAG TPA: hypothetical protein VIU62_09550 [Chloroflexota bacterium]